jgi:hypothetical protein
MENKLSTRAAVLADFARTLAQQQDYRLPNRCTSVYECADSERVADSSPWTPKHTTSHLLPNLWRTINFSDGVFRALNQTLQLPITTLYHGLKGSKISILRF